MEVPGFRPIPVAASPPRLLTPRDQNHQISRSGLSYACRLTVIILIVIINIIYNIICGKLFNCSSDFTFFFISYLIKLLLIKTTNDKNNVGTEFFQIFEGANIFSQPSNHEIGREEIANAKYLEQIL